jgi:thioredoxin-disulfide reductase
MYDTIIIGAGPAGFTAGIYAARREMKTLIIGKEPGGQLVWASEIENYPGFKKIDNFDLITKMQEQVKALGVEMATGEVQRIEKMEDDNFKIVATSGEYKAKTVIVAMGLSPRRLEIPGEKEFNARGVTYCANCDGPFYRDKEVAVVGGGNSALDAAEVLSKIASKVYLVHRKDTFRAFEYLVDEVKEKENIELVLNSEIKQISGEDKVNKIVVFDNKKEEEKEIKVDGVFIEIGRIASTDLVENLVERDEKMQILIDEKCHTKTKGLFACGDVTQVPFKQITIACGQATIAALAAYEYLQSKQGKKNKVILDRSH